MYIFNKMDLYRERNFDDFLEAAAKEEILNELKNRLKNQYEGRHVFISALTKENIGQLKQEITQMVKEQYVERYPYQAKKW